MSMKKVLGVALAAGAGALAGLTIGYLKGLTEIVEITCPENCECKGDCAFCAGAHAVAADAQSAESVCDKGAPGPDPVQPVEEVPAEVFAEDAVADTDVVVPGEPAAEMQ